MPPRRPPPPSPPSSPRPCRVVAVSPSSPAANSSSAGPPPPTSVPRAGPCASTPRRCGTRSARSRSSCVGTGLDTRADAPRVLDAPRYRAMEAYFDSRWPAGRTMMRNTASIQVNLDVGSPATTDARWHLAHDIGPVLTACFANSPFDASGNPSGYRSTRAAVWHAIDPARTDSRPPRPRRAARDAWERVRAGRDRDDDPRRRRPQRRPARADVVLAVAHARPRAGGGRPSTTSRTTDHVVPAGAAARLARAAHDRRAPRGVVAGGGRGDHRAARRPRGGRVRGCATRPGARPLDRRGARRAGAIPSSRAVAVRCFEAARRRAPPARGRRRRLGARPTSTSSGTSPGAGARPTSSSRTGCGCRPRASDVIAQAASSWPRSTRAVAAPCDLLAPVPDDRQRVQVSELMSPLVWDLAHIGHYEELWLVRELAARAPIDAALRRRLRRVQAPPSRAAVARRSSTPRGARALRRRGARRASLDVLDRIDLDRGDPLLADGFVYGMVVQHEHQHDETLLATLQLMRRLRPSRRRRRRRRRGRLPGRRSTLPPDVLVPGGTFVMGTDDRARGPTTTSARRTRSTSPPFRIDTTPVTNGAYARVRRRRRLRRPRAAGPTPGGRGAPRPG